MAPDDNRQAHSMVVNGGDATPVEIHVESLVGRTLLDVDGRKIGRVEELVVELLGTEWAVVELHVGIGALLERVVELSTLVPMMGALRRKLSNRYRVPWQQLDLRDPDHPCALVRVGDLKRLEA
jgi:sporulation protein YlmC with PRC-barrel domain